VRELRNVIERAVILESSPEVRPSSLPDFHFERRLRKGGEPAGRLPTGVSLEDAVGQYERDLIIRTLEVQHYNLAKAAEQLKITRHALRYRVQRLNIPLRAGADESEDYPGRPDTAT
jgi:DNA-binding NtrC family response regulator